MDHPNQGGDKDEQFPGLLAQDDEIFFEELKSLLEVDDDIPDSIWEGAGMVQPGAPTALGAPEFAYDENQTLSSHDEEANKQQCDQLIADTFGLLQPPTMLLGQRDVSYSIDQFSPPPASITQLLENQMPAEIQPLIQEQLDPAAERERIRLERKRASGRAYCQRKREKTQELTNRNQELQNANQVKDQLLNALRAQMEDHLQKEQQQLEKITKAEAEIERWKEKYLLLNKRSENNSRQENQLRQQVRAMRKQLKNLGKLCIKKAKKKLKKQVMMVGTAEETESVK